MSRGLQGRVAVVTGASAGAGRGIAERLAADGATVYCCGRTLETLEVVCAAIGAAGGRAVAVALDITKPEHTGRIGAALRTNGDGLDIFVSNAGGPDPFGGWDELDDAAWEQTFAFNVFAVVRLTRALLPLLRASAAGRIVLVGSTSALEPNRYNPHYAAAKAAVHNFGKYLSAELAPIAVTVNVVAPATLESRSRERNMVRRSRLEGLEVEVIRRRTEANERSKIPLGRIGTPRDIAAVVGFLVSDDAAWMTGSTIVVDGGSTKSAW